VVNDVKDAKNLNDVKFPDKGQTIILKEIYGKKKIKRVKCTVEGIYKTYILVERLDSRIKESYMKVDFLTGYLQYEMCV
jgi:uncharacterized protein Veg